MKTNSFANNLKSDLFKVRKLKSVWIGLALSMVLILLSYAVVWIANYVLGLSNPQTPEEEIALAQALAMIATVKETSLFGSVSTCSMELFVAIIICIFVGKDFSNGGISMLVARGGKKANIYFSKFVTITLLILLYSAVSLVFSGILTAIGGYGKAFTGADFGLLMRNFFLQILCGISTASIFLMIAFLTRSSGTALATTIGTYLVLSIVLSLISTFSGLIEETASNWLSFMPFRQMDIAATPGKWEATNTIAVSVMPVIYTIISCLIGYFTFERRDLKR